MPRVLIGAINLRNVDGPYRTTLAEAGFEVV